MLQTIREFGLEELAKHGEEAVARTAHAMCFASSAEEAARHLSGAEEGRWLDRIGVDIDNIRAALDWLIRTGDKAGALGIATAIKSYWLIRSSYTEALPWLEQALALPGAIEPRLQLRASRLAAWVFTMAGQQERASTFAEQALTLSRQIGDEAGNATTFNTLGAMAFHRGDLPQARRWWEEALSIADPSASSRMLAGIYNNLGVVAAFQGEIEQALSYQEQSLALNRALGTRSHEAGNLDNLAHLACLGGEIDRAAELVAEALGVYAEFHHRAGIADVLATGAEVARARGLPLVAAQLLAAAEAHRADIAYVLPPIQQRDEEAISAWSRQALGDDAFAAAWNDGAAASIEDLLATVRALATPESTAPSPTATPPAGLTPRELEIIRLLVDGLSNQQIADALSISLRTAQTHVANILNKLGSELAHRRRGARRPHGLV
jgi:ATP/maltotriose-dependent transcriptional regulator MalT